MISRITPGDILAVRGTSWLADKIMKVTGGPCSHVGLFLSGGEEPLILEATPKRVVTCLLSDSLLDVKKAWVLHPLNISKDQRLVILRSALVYSGRSYGWWNLLLQYADVACDTNFFSRHFTLSHYPICSAIAAKAYADCGLYFGQRPHCLSPSEIFTYAEKNDDKYKIWEIK